jgi:hypothetical protein
MVEKRPSANATLSDSGYDTYTGEGAPVIQLFLGLDRSERLL